MRYREVGQSRAEKKENDKKNPRKEKWVVYSPDSHVIATLLCNWPLEVRAQSHHLCWVF